MTRTKNHCKIDQEWCGLFIGRKYCSYHDVKFDSGDCPGLIEEYGNEIDHYLWAIEQCVYDTKPYFQPSLRLRMLELSQKPGLTLQQRARFEKLSENYLAEHPPKRRWWRFEWRFGK